MKIINVGNMINNNYIIKLSKGYLLIDTGYPGQFENFKKRLRRHNIDIKEISYILLTHVHNDHAGFLNEVLNNSDAKVILHPKAVDRLKEGINSFEGGCAGRLALTFYGIMKLFGKGEYRFPPVDRPERDILFWMTSHFRQLRCSYPVLLSIFQDTRRIRLDCCWKTGRYFAGTLQ